MNIDTQAQPLTKIKLDTTVKAKVVEQADIRKAVVNDKVALSKEGQRLAQEFQATKSLDSETQKLTKMSALTKRISGSRFINKPAIFFIGGFNFFSTSTNDGMKDMAEHVRGARFYNWDQKSDMLKEILKRPAHQPVVLVGHSLGGDTAVEMANELNSIDHNFRKVELLVTLDSFGMNNDIIPQNVQKNMNFIGHRSMWLNDGPNIARVATETIVTNELRDEEHTDLDDAEQIQYKILNEIELIKESKEVKVQKANT